MKHVLGNSLLQLATRLLVGCIFVYASVEKVFDPGAFSLLIDNYKMLPAGYSLIIASTLPWVELVCGLAIIFGTGTRGAALVLGLLTVGFTGAVASGIVRGLDISCGCYTLDPTVGKIGWPKVIENTGLVLLFLFLVYSTGTRYTLDSMFRSRSGPEGGADR